jgi:hypothetical protein
MTACECSMSAVICACIDGAPSTTQLSPSATQHNGRVIRVSTSKNLSKRYWKDNISQLTIHATGWYQSSSPDRQALHVVPVLSVEASGSLILTGRCIAQNDVESAGNSLLATDMALADLGWTMSDHIGS